jgi:hypothetical protein
MKTALLLLCLTFVGCELLPGYTPPEKRPPPPPPTACSLEVEVNHEGQKYPDYAKTRVENVQASECKMQSIRLTADGELYFDSRGTPTLIARKVMSYKIIYMRMR